MRLIAAVLLGAFMLFAVPTLWERAMVNRVNQIASGPPPIPVGNAIAAVDLNLTMNAINPPVEINTEEYEKIAVQSQVDQSIRQVQAAQDQAWQSTH